MAPVKFDDISKTASEVLGDDYQTAGFQFKAKQKTSWNGAVMTSAVDLFPPKDTVMTPAKLSWKIPAPFGFSGVSIDKLEMDKAGKFKLEASSDKVYPALKVEAKSDLVEKSKVIGCLTYSGINDTLLKLETKVMNPKDFTAEVTHAVGKATLGMKCGMANMTAPDLGVRFLSGKFFCSLLVKEKLSAFTAHAFCKASDELKCAATVEYGGKKSGEFSFGLAYDVVKGTQLKFKVQHDQSLSCSVKHELSKGFTLLAGGKFDSKKKDYTYGLQLSIE